MGVLKKILSAHDSFKNTFLLIFSIKS